MSSKRQNRIQREKFKKIIVVEIILSLVLLCAILLFFIFGDWRKAADEEDEDLVQEVAPGEIEIQPDKDSEDKEASDEEEAEKEEEESKEQETDIDEDREEDSDEAPAPDYDFIVEEVTVPIKRIDREYTFVWVSDLHMITDHEPGKGADAGYMDAIKERYDELPVDKNGVHAEDIWPEIVKYINYVNPDGVIFGGDMIDYCSESNIEALKEGMEQIKVPILYIRADHDMAIKYGGSSFSERDSQKLHEELDGNDSKEKCWRFPKFTLAGVDNSNKDMSQKTMWMLEDEFNDCYSVVVATHVPYASQVDDSLKEMSMKVRNTEYYWGGEKYKPNVYTEEYLNMVYRDNSKVAEVLGGHIHSSWDGQLTEYTSQHVFGPAYEGHVGLITMVYKPGADGT